MKAYADCVSATTTRDSPWYVVPADNKATWLIISQIILNTLEELKLDYPKLTKHTARSYWRFGNYWRSRIDPQSFWWALISFGAELVED